MDKEFKNCQSCRMPLKETKKEAEQMQTKALAKNIVPTAMKMANLFTKEIMF